MLLQWINLFEPIKETSLKHLTFKTASILALGSGKRKSEIHACQNKNIRDQSDWSKVSLYPSSSFHCKKQLVKEGPDSGYPSPDSNWSPMSDRSFCPVRALHNYLDKTSDLRQNKELVFVSFKKGFVNAKVNTDPMDRQGPPSRPCYQLTVGLNRFRQRKSCYDITLSRQEGSMIRYLANAQPFETQDVLLSFGGPVCADRISDCPLGRVLTYKNLLIKFEISQPTLLGP